MRIVCISDTHGNHRLTDVPEGDILIHAGDLTRRGQLLDVAEFDRWLGTLPHRHKIVIAGNHDFCFQEQTSQARSLVTNTVFLQDEAVEIEGIRFYGSPWQPWFGGWAFNFQRGPELAAIWAKIPVDTQILITHGPPEGILDLTHRGEHTGCRDLSDRVKIVRPNLHVFGHIHEAAGREEIDGITFLNASTDLGRGTGRVVDWPIDLAIDL